ncbi:MAG: outer membrane beta-barrel protein [Verrucomicrobia bacterium]|nr:outer membrane beta-barrel protein [Verrucomicrobiota bacterium]
MRLLALSCILLFPFALQAADLELKSLGDAASGQAKRKYGPYVGVGIGASLGQEGKLRGGGQIKSDEGAAIFSIEVGKSWKLKRVPLMFSLEGEGTFMSTSLTDATSGLALADMNSLMFNLNGTLALDLYRYRARIGKFAAGFRPYIGGGAGGGQVWFRNAATTGAATPFTIDEFINSWNWYAGVEWTWKDQYSVFAEYRDTHFGDLEDLTGYATDGYLVGFRYRY